MFEIFKKIFKKEEKEAEDKTLIGKEEEKKAEKPEKRVKIYSLNLIVDKEKIEHVQKVLEDIVSKDASFPKPTQQGYLIVLSGSENLDDLHKKGMWLTKKVDGVIGYFIREIK